MTLASAVTVALAAIAVLCGCATAPVATSDAQPASEVLAPAMTRPSPGSQPVTFKRDTGGNNAACSARVFVDGRPIADLRTGQAITVYLAPGEYIAGARMNGICFAGDAETSIRVTPARAAVFRVGVDAGGALRLSPTAF